MRLPSRHRTSIVGALLPLEVLVIVVARRVLIGAVLSVFAAGGIAHAQQPVFPAGVGIGLVVPDSMVAAGAFSGFEDRSRAATILISELPAEAFAVLERGLTKVALANEGITETGREAVTLADGVPAILIAATQSANTVTLRKWLLIARGPASTALVTAQVAPQAGDAYSDAAMRRTLLSLVFRALPPIEDQVTALPFTLGARGGFRPVRVMGGNALYLTDGPKDSDPGGEQPVVVIARSLDGAPDPREIDQFARQLFGGLPGVSKVRLERAENQRIRGVPGHEIRADGADSSGETKIKLVQWVRVERGSYLRIVAFVPIAQFDAVFPRLRAIRDGIEMK